MLISWYTFSLISLFIISVLITCIISKMYFFCSLFFVSYLIFLIIISECIFLLILMSIFTSFFFMFLNISLILISCITTSKLILHKHAFNNISLIQKSFFFNVFLLLFILIQNISSFDYLFITFMFLRVNSISSTLIFLAHLTMFFVIVVMILFTSSFSLMKIFTSNFLQWFLSHWWWYVNIEHKMTFKWCCWLHARSLHSAVNVFSLLYELFFKSVHYLFQSFQLILHALIDSWRSDTLTHQLFYHFCQTSHLFSEHQLVVFTFVELIEYSQLV